MKYCAFLLHSTILSTCWFQTTTSTQYPSGKEALYYGFFFNETVASSIQILSDTYFDACFAKFPEFQTFMRSALASANLTDIHEYFKRPLDPNTLTFDPTFHVTAKYCGEADCSSYRNQIAEPHINHDFEMHLIGYYWTNRTFGVRVQLTPEQETLFETDPAKREGGASSWRQFGAITATLPGIRLENFPGNFTPTRNKAHVTIGTAPTVSAVVTGTDLDTIIIFENDPTIPRTNVSIDLDVGDQLGSQATIVHYFGGGQFGDAFVVYPSLKGLATAKFQPYLKPVSSSAMAKNINFVLLLLTFSYQLIMKSLQK